MKKIAKNIAVVMAMATVLVGCGKANESNSSSTNNTKVENSATTNNENKTDEKNTKTIESNEKLAQSIISDFKLSEDESKNNQYTYAPVELSKDGGNEVLVLLKGDAFSGTGGTTMALYSEKDGNFTKVQDWTLINSPVYISNEESNGYKTIVFQAGGGGADSEWKSLEFNGKEYNTVNDAKTVDFNSKDASQTLFEDNATYFNLK